MIKIKKNKRKRKRKRTNKKEGKKNEITVTHALSWQRGQIDSLAIGSKFM